MAADPYQRSNRPSREEPPLWGPPMDSEAAQAMPEASRLARHGHVRLAYPGVYRTILNWKLAWPNATIRRTQTSSESVCHTPW